MIVSVLYHVQNKKNLNLKLPLSFLNKLINMKYYISHTSLKLLWLAK